MIDELKQAEIDLSEYKSETETGPEIDEQINEKAAEQTSDFWRGNPAYFQTGKKQGQLRPSAVQPKETTLSDSVLSGYVLLLIIDFIAPMLISFAGKMFTKKKISPALLSLTSKQKKELEPIADEVSKIIHLSPIQVLIVSLAGIYAGNFISLSALSKDDLKELEKNGR